MSLPDYVISDLLHPQTWTDAITRLPHPMQSVFATPQYYSLYENEMNGIAKCFIFSSGGNLALFPFLQNKIKHPDLDNKATLYNDIQGAPGYNGFYYNCTDGEFISDFFGHFNDYCKNENIITEFIRFDPVLRNEAFQQGYEIIKQNLNVIVDLRVGDLWMKSYEHSARKNVNKAIRSGLTADFVSGNDMTDEDISRFYSIYSNTMERNNVPICSRHDQDFITRICKVLGSQCLFYFTLYENKPVSTELVLLNNHSAYSFLGGTIAEYFALRPNDLLKHNLIESMKTKGIQFYCIGGGRIPNDGIFKYKRSFAKSGMREFYIGKKIHDMNIYQFLVKSWDSSHPEEAGDYQDFFLRYRLK